MNKDGTKIVNYALYCKDCKHFDLSAAEDPCDKCLSRPVNTYSEKPMYFEDASEDE